MFSMNNCHLRQLQRGLYQELYQGLYQARALAIVLCGILVSLLAGCASPPVAAQPAQSVAGGDAQRGAVAIQSYGCGSCHNIPGIPGADAMVGPPLDGWAERRYIAGSLLNEPQHLIEWIRFPQAIEPGSAMPNMGISEQEARDISAYLYTLTDDSWMEVGEILE